MGRWFWREISVLGAFVALSMVACASKQPEGSRGSTPATAGQGGASDLEPEAGAAGDSTGSAAGDSTGSAAGDSNAGDPRPPDPLTLGEPCNGRMEYCALAYDEVCFAATHDSAAGSADYWQVPVQDRSILEQLQSGIRALSLSVFDDHGTVTVCRNDCTEGNTALSVVLGEVAKFFEQNPREVVTLLVDSNLEAAVLSSPFAAKGLDKRALVQDPSDQWPTLGAMIDAGTRLVVFAATSDEGPAWLLPRQTFLWETGRDWPSLAAMNCNPEVGSEARPLYLVHHNLFTAGDSGGLPNAELAAKANELAVVTDRLEKCRDQYGRAPNFVAVDFSSQGNVTDAAQVLTGERAR